MSWLRLALLAIVIVSAARADGAELPRLPAPFGLTWLMSIAEVGARGIELGRPESGRFGQSCLANGLPRQFNDQFFSVLSFGYDDQLIRITAVGGQFASDRDLSRVRKRYIEVAEILSKKYGPGKVDENIDSTWSGERTASGLRNNKNWLYRIFDADGVHIELSVFSEADARTSWRLIFEYIDGMKRMDEERRRVDESTL